MLICLRLFSFFRFLLYWISCKHLRYLQYSYLHFYIISLITFDIYFFVNFVIFYKLTDFNKLTEISSHLNTETQFYSYWRWLRKYGSKTTWLHKRIPASKYVNKLKKYYPIPKICVFAECYCIFINSQGYNLWRRAFLIGKLTRTSRKNGPVKIILERVLPKMS